MEARAQSLSVNTDPDPEPSPAEDDDLLSGLPEMEDLENPAHEEDSAPELKRVQSIISTPWTWERLFYRGITAGSVGFSPLFALFAYQAMADVRDLALKEFGEEDS